MFILCVGVMVTRKEGNWFRECGMLGVRCQIKTTKWERRSTSMMS